MRNIIVQKYGGTSVADPRRIKEVAQRIIKAKRRGKKVVVVISALGNATDELLALAGRVTSSPSFRELDMLLATGEQVAAALLAMAIQEQGAKAISFTGAQVGIITDYAHTRARIIRVNTKRVEDELQKGKIVIVAGFQGVSENQDITTLGRGGSNLTAVALSRSLNAESCEMFTDVEGIYTADPRIVPDARKLDRLSYEEMLELASSGAQVLQSQAVVFAQKHRVPIRVRSSFSESSGTLISEEVKKMEEQPISGVTLTRNEAKITICDVPDRPGIAAKIFGQISRENINIDMIIQNISRTRKTDISFTVLKEDLNRTLKVARRVAAKVGAARVVADEDIAKISVVGVGMRTHSGIAARMFRSLARKKINIEMISTSEIKISCVIRKKAASRAVRAIHKEFGLGKRG